MQCFVLQISRNMIGLDENIARLYRSSRISETGASLVQSSEIYQKSFQTKMQRGCERKQKNSKSFIK